MKVLLELCHGHLLDFQVGHLAVRRLSPPQGLQGWQTVAQRGDGALRSGHGRRGAFISRDFNGA